MTETISTHYGLLNTPEGVMYLHQGRASNNFIGLNKRSPIEVQTFKNKACPHQINISVPVPDRVHWGTFLRVLDDHLVQAMLPIPKTPHSLVPYINDPQNQFAMILVILSRLSSPIYPLVMDINKWNKTQLMAELSVTNISPIVLTGVQTSDQSYVNDICNEARFLPRKLVLTGDHTLVVRPPMVRIETAMLDFDELQLAALPMEQLGALVLKRHARGEQINAEFARN